MVGVGAAKGVEVLLPSRNDLPNSAPDDSGSGLLGPAKARAALRTPQPEEGREQAPVTEKSKAGGSRSKNRRSKAKSVEAAAAEALADAIHAAALLQPGDRVKLAQRAQREFAAIETTALAELKAAGASDRDVTRRARAGGTRSRKETSKLNKRADAVKRNPTLATKLGNGSLGEDHVDAIAEAAAKTGGDAATDQQLINDVADSTPDDAHKITTRWLENREGADAAQTRYDRQHKRRKAATGYDPRSGCDTFTASGPTERVREMKHAAEQLADEFYEADGGRDLPDDQHPRTHHQRMFDAAYQLITGKTLNSTGTATGTANTCGGNCTTGKAKQPHPKTMLHVFLVVDRNAEQQIKAHCPNGDGYLPASVLEDYACGAMIGGTVFSESGEILWHGRSLRCATPEQWTALIARDKGCVLCGKDPSRCEAHHLKPFNAPVKGETNIDDLALVCTSCHHWLHDSKHTLYRKPTARGSDDEDGDGDTCDVSMPLRTQAFGQETRLESPRRTVPNPIVWATRPAQHNEIAPTTKTGQHRTT